MSMYSPLASPKKTIEVLQSHGLYTKKRLGQHFLVDDNTIGKILDLAKLSSDDVVLEVGPGIGTLSYALLEHTKHLIAIEFDKDMHAVLEETVAPRAKELNVRFSLIEADAAKVLPEDLPEAPTTLVANLPYQVAATVVLRFFQLIPTLKQATVMVQAEVADRMSAAPGNKTYGSYTAKLQVFAKPSGRFEVSRQSFLPPPRVESSVIRLEKNTEVLDHLKEQNIEVEDLSRFVDAAFAQRRKTIRNSLRANFCSDGGILDEAFSKAGISPSVRAETLDIFALIKLRKNIQEF